MTIVGIGSVLLLPEILSTPWRDGATDEVRLLAGLLARLDLRPVDRAIAELITNNQRDFPATITEIHVTYPADLTGTGA